ncbi:sigma 54-interacting transcriptional regulator [Clostridium estertheticum]|uniref:sigma 54-interacting transcriptional regulator n=1 Tax=Clostridium estertheticum TaxID=238834 RepID=UPI001C6E0532|nr:sigma 54-interacting transcriptional regulator [Clostridium estertheticum]MBW9171560.1 sigma 54-interacting transcriptional regulator [Clostridium estertheticum]WLC77057.1 sigma 54-interacting transcriptional regulator [Clostridium estertheticum]
MPKILFIVPMEENKITVSKTIEEYKHYFDPNFNEKNDSEIEIVVQIYGEKVNLHIYNADIIVARGFTAITLKKLYPDTPIVEIPITTMDVVSSVNTLQKENINNNPIALIGFGDISFQAHTASQLCHVSVVPYNFYYKKVYDNDISILLDKILSKGFRHIIGGMRMLEMANEKKFFSTFIQLGRESIWLALREAHHIAGIRRKERERAAHFETILNHSHEGIISTDMDNKIIHINSSVSKILGIDTSVCIGANLEKIITDPKFVIMLHDEKDYSDELFKVKTGKIILNKAGTSLGNEMIGNVFTFQNIYNIQSTEFKIRNKLHHKELVAKYNFTDIIGESVLLKKAIKKSQTFARVSSNILIIGDTGTGKELFSQSIHNYSRCKNGPFVAVNCAAIPENLMESEFFGYVGGAFTGASKDGKMGFFELAHEGTIFLDEISEIPLNLQGKLLRVIQEREVMRIGHDKIIPINIRIICATNKDLKFLVEQGKFREDLYYRLSVLQLRLPTLHERGKDIILLANHFIAIYASNFSKSNIILSPEAQKLFLSYSWHGNIRELHNVCEQLVVLNETGIISAQEVSTILSIDTNEDIKDHSILKLPLSNNFSEERKQFEKTLIIKALKESNCNKTKAASLLCMNRSTLWKKLKEYKIECKISLL